MIFIHQWEHFAICTPLSKGHGSVTRAALQDGQRRRRQSSPDPSEQRRRAGDRGEEGVLPMGATQLKAPPGPASVASSSSTWTEVGNRKKTVSRGTDRESAAPSLQGLGLGGLAWIQGPISGSVRHGAARFVTSSNDRALLSVFLYFSLFFPSVLFRQPAGKAEHRGGMWSGADGLTWKLVFLNWGVLFNRIINIINIYMCDCICLLLLLLLFPSESPWRGCRCSRIGRYQVWYIELGWTGNE